MRVLDDEERLDWLQLIRTDSIGPITFHRLIKKYGSAAKALSALPDLSTKAGRKRMLRPASRDEARQEIEIANDIGARLIAHCEPDYPALLRAIADPPPLIYVCGDVALFQQPGIAIIGARNASAAGRKFARSLAGDLGAEGITVISGLARGIDGAAHEAAIETGTIAVVGGGVDVIYPPEHAELTQTIASRGVLMSERPPNYQPTARDFPRRNRLISGLSRGVVVIEAAAKSGTLITARFALEQGRDVFAVPGSPLDPRCAGANNLIRDGATLVQDVQDILTALAEQTTSAGLAQKNLFSLDDDGRDFSEFTSENLNEDASQALRDLVLESLSYTPVHRDDLIRDLNASPSLIIDALLDLALSGEAEEVSGGQFARIASEHY